MLPTTTFMIMAPNGEKVFLCGKANRCLALFVVQKGEDQRMKQQRDINVMEIWSAKELVQAGFTRTMAYQLLSRADVPTIRIGGRLFVRRETFISWLKAQERHEA